MDWKNMINTFAKVFNVFSSHFHYNCGIFNSNKTLKIPRAILFYWKIVVFVAQEIKRSTNESRIIRVLVVGFRELLLRTLLIYAWRIICSDEVAVISNSFMSEQSKHTDMKLKPVNSRSPRTIIITQSLKGVKCT